LLYEALQLGLIIKLKEKIRANNRAETVYKSEKESIFHFPIQIHSGKSPMHFMNKGYPFSNSSVCLFLFEDLQVVYGRRKRARALQR